jgi:hypothetical protein
MKQANPSWFCYYHLKVLFIFLYGYHRKMHE